MVTLPPELLGDWVVHLSQSDQRKLGVYRLVSQDQPITLDMMNEHRLSTDERALLDQLRSLPEDSEQRLAISRFVRQLDSSRLTITQQQMHLEVGTQVASVEWEVVSRNGRNVTVVTHEPSGEFVESTLRLSTDGRLILIGSTGEELVLVRP